jgi:uncharacterized membrane protein
MSKTSGRDSRDLALTAAASLASPILMAVPVDGLVKGIVLVPMVMLLPGYAVTAAMFPFPTLGRAERLVYVVSIGVSAAVLSGLIWQLAFGLGRFAWAFLLTTVVLSGCAIARHRRASAPIQDKAFSPSRGTDRGLARMPKLDVPTAIGVLVALGLAIAAIAVASDGLREERAESHFSALWAAAVGAAPKAVEIGVWNHQGAVHEYRLDVRSAGRTLRRWQGRLGSHAQKQLVLSPATFPSGARLVVSLYRDGSLYRRTELQTGSGT